MQHAEIVGAIGDRSGKTLAIVGLVVSCLSTLGWLALAVLFIRSRH